MRKICAAYGLALLAGGAMAGGEAAANWRENVSVLRVGMLVTGDLSGARTRIEPFRAYMEDRLGVSVEMVPAQTYQSLIDATLSGTTQYAVHSATSYAVAQAACDCLDPLAVSSSPDGVAGFYSVLLVRADSEITDIGSAAGKKLALSEGDSLAGRLVPLKGLAEEGIDPAEHFSSVEEVAGPDAAVRKLLAGEADVAAGWSSLSGDPIAGYSFGVLTRLVIEGALAETPLRAIWQSPRIPFGPHAVRKDMDPELKALIADALFVMSEQVPDALDAIDRSGYGGGGFLAVSDADYDVIKGLVASADSASISP